MSGDRGHPDGPDTDLLVSLHQLLQAGHGVERQLRLPRLPPLHRALLLTGLADGVLHGERQAVAIDQASGGVDESGSGEAARGGVLRMGGRAAAAGL